MTNNLFHIVCGIAKGYFKKSTGKTRFNMNGSCVACLVVQLKAHPCKRKIDGSNLTLRENFNFLLLNCFAFLKLE